MWKVILYALFCLMFLSSVSNAGTDKSIILVADEWCPYNCQANSPNPGILVELAKGAWEPLGYKITYKTLPWARAKLYAKHADNTGLLGVGRGFETQGFLYPSKALLQSPFCFYSRLDEEWKFTGLASLRKIRLGTSYYYNYDGEIGAYIQNGIESQNPDIQAATGENPAQTNIHKLNTGRLDAVLEDRLVMSYVASLHSIRNLSKEVGCLKQDNSVYIVLSEKLKSGKKLVQALDKYVEKSKKDGSFTQLLRKYQILQ